MDSDKPPTSYQQDEPSSDSETPSTSQQQPYRQDIRHSLQSREAIDKIRKSFQGFFPGGVNINITESQSQLDAREEDAATTSSNITRKRPIQQGNQPNKKRKNEDNFSLTCIIDCNLLGCALSTGTGSVDTTIHNHPQSNENNPESINHTDEQETKIDPEKLYLELIEFLKKNAREVYGNIEPSINFSLPTRMDPVKLQITSDLKRLLPCLRKNAFYKIRSDCENIHTSRKSYITLEELFDKAKGKAELNATNNTNTEEAKDAYIAKHGNRVTLLGHAGIGKTILARQMLELYNGRPDNNAKYIFFIDGEKLNELMNGEPLTFIQFVLRAGGCYDEWMEMQNNKHDVETDTSLFNGICKESANVVFIIDGLDKVESDKLSGNASGSSVKTLPKNFLRNILTGKLLPRAKKFVTCRPREYFALQKQFRIGLLVEIIGLDEEQRDKLCEHICGDKYAKVKQYLKEHPDVLASCYVPVKCYIISSVLSKAINENGDVDVDSLTSLFVEVLSYYVGSSHVGTHIDEVWKLTDLALNGIKKSQCIFNKNEIFKVSTQAIGTFLVTFVKNICNDISPKCHFPHLVWQELFASIELMLVMPEDDFMECLNEIPKETGEVVTIFMFGLFDYEVYRTLTEVLNYQNVPRLEWVRKKQILTQHLRDLLPSTSQDTRKLLQLCSLLHAADSDKLYLKVLDEMPTNIAINHVTIQPTDASNISYVLKKSNKSFELTFKDVTFSNNSFREFCKGLSACKSKVKKLTIRGNNIGDDAKHLATCLHNIEELDVSKCGCGYCITVLKIKKLTIRGNNIGNDAKHLATCLHNIEELDVSECGITDVGEIAKKLEVIAQPMRKLDLHYNEIGDKGAEELAAYLHNIEELDVRFCGITKVGVEIIAIKLSSRVDVLKKLAITGELIGNDGAKHLATCLHNIKELDVSECGITDVGEIAKKLKEIDQPMRKLDLHYNEIGDKGAEELAAYLHNIEELDVRFCGITKVGVEIIAIKLSSRVDVLKKLAITGELIGNDGAKHLATCLHNIKELDVSECGITDVGEIAKKLKEIDQPMRKLDLHYNNIGDKGAEELAGCLHNIEALDVRFCRITKVGVERIANKLSSRVDVLKKLAITGELIGNDGAKHLATCLHNIEELDVSECGITDVGEIAKKLKEIDQPLKKLDLSYNPIGRNGAELVGCLDKVEVLDVSFCKITEVGIENIKSELKSQVDQQIHQTRVVGLERQYLP